MVNRLQDVTDRSADLTPMVDKIFVIETLMLALGEAMEQSAIQSLHLPSEESLARDWPEHLPVSVPRLERFYSADFPCGHSNSKVCCVYRFRRFEPWISAPSAESLVIFFERQCPLYKTYY
ncbi:hypothetical protein FHU14_001981 [Mesorhizobium sp. RMAD-H1]|nr:hypothetical protein [Mesorhizobium sp. RMAD-H1]